MTHEYDFGGGDLGDGAPASEGGAPLGWRSPALAPITLRLITPRLLVEGRSSLGRGTLSGPLIGPPSPSRHGWPWKRESLTCLGRALLTASPILTEVLT